jgi:hypothetical protein
MLISAVLDYTYRKSFTLSYCTSSSFVVPSFAIAMFKRAITVFVLSFLFNHTGASPSSWSQNIIQCQDFFPVVRVGSLHTLTRKEMLLLPLLGPMGETHSLAGEGWGPNSDKGTDTLILYVYYISLIYSPDADFLLMLVRMLCQWHRPGIDTFGLWLVTSDICLISYLSFWLIVSQSILGRFYIVVSVSSTLPIVV